MRLILEPVHVILYLGIPQLIRWHNTQHTVVEVLDSWSSRRLWWSSDEYRRYFLLRTTHTVMEVYSHNQRWILSRIAD
jgi:hypothetical protein